jgi:hypothetical protein
MMSGAERMKLSIVAVLAWTACTGAAYAQAPAGTSASTPSKGYAEVVAQSSFGNVTSQSYGGEVGVSVGAGVQVFGEFGYTRDAAPASLGASAQTIAAGITAVAGTTTFTVKQPVTFGLGGLKYVVSTSSGKIAPYVLAGGGVASVKRDVTFSTPAGDVNQFVTLGEDLTGSETAGMISFGGGIGIPAGRALIFDVNYRYGHVFTSGEALNINRVGLGIGVRF